MIISSSFCYLFFHWRCFKVSFSRQCSIVVLRSSIPRFSIVPGVFRCSGGVPLFRRCFVVQRVFRVPVLFRRSAGVSCSGVPVVFYCSAGIPCSVVPCSGIPGYIVCHNKCNRAKGRRWKLQIYAIRTFLML